MFENLDLPIMKIAYTDVCCFFMLWLKVLKVALAYDGCIETDRPHKEEEFVRT